MTRQFGDDFEAKEEYNFRFGDPDQDGGREHHMVLRQTEGVALERHNMENTEQNPERKEQ